MQAVTVPTSNMMAYMRRDEVELRHDGQAEQHSEQAALPQQQANWNFINVRVTITGDLDELITCAAEQRPKTAPMLLLRCRQRSCPVTNPSLLLLRFNYRRRTVNLLLAVLYRL